MPFDVVEPVAPEDEPISVDSLRAHLRLPIIDGGHPDDEEIKLAASAARDHAERYCGRPFAKQTIELREHTWPLNTIDIPYAVDQPVIESVKYRDSDGVVQTLATSEYDLGRWPDGHGWTLVRPSASTWPVSASGSAGIVVRYVVGTGPLPASVRAALLLLTGHLYNNRSAVSDRVMFEIPFGIKALLDPYRVNLGV